METLVWFRQAAPSRSNIHVGLGVLAWMGRMCFFMVQKLMCELSSRFLFPKDLLLKFLNIICPWYDQDLEVGFVP